MTEPLLDKSDAEENLSHHGAGDSILTPRDLFIAECVVAWMATAKAAGGFSYGANWMPHRPDFEKSRLFWRFRARKTPLPHPPPTCYSCPWYEVVEELTPHWSFDGGVFQWQQMEKPCFSLGQCSYDIIESDDKGVPTIVGFGPWKFKVWRGAHPTMPDNQGWYIQRIEQ